MHCHKCGAQVDDQATSCDKCGTALQNDSLAPGARTPAPATAYQYAGFWKRFAAFLLDQLIVGAITVLLLLVLTAMGVMSVSDMQAGATAAESRHYLLVLSIVGIAILAPEILLFAIMESSKYQATPGKLALGIRVADIGGRRVSFARAIGRNLAKNTPGAIMSGLSLLYTVAAGDPRATSDLFSLADALLEGSFFAIIAFTGRKQGLHDVVTGCLVVLKKPSPKAAAPAPTSWATVRHAGILRRLAAALIDGALLIIVWFAVAVAIDAVYSAVAGRQAEQPDSTKEAIGDAAFAATVFLGWLYYTVMESSEGGATLGKMALRLRVADSSGKRLSFARAAVRSLGRIASMVMLGLGFVTIALTEKQQGLHDIMPDSVVVRKQPKVEG